MANPYYGYRQSCRCTFEMPDAKCVIENCSFKLHPSDHNQKVYAEVEGYPVTITEKSKMLRTLKFKEPAPAPVGEELTTFNTGEFLVAVSNTGDTVNYIGIGAIVQLVYSGSNGLRSLLNLRTGQTIPSTAFGTYRFRLAADGSTITIGG